MMASDKIFKMVVLSQATLRATKQPGRWFLDYIESWPWQVSALDKLTTQNLEL